MRKTAFIICGLGNSGKTKTARSLIKRYLKPKDNKHVFIGNVSNKTKTFFMWLNSPQEKTGARFDYWKESLKTVRQNAELCEKLESKFAIVMTFNIHQSKHGLNKKSIFNPIRFLKKKGYRVKVVYLRKNTLQSTKVDHMMRNLRAHVIESKKGKYDIQSRKLFIFIRKVLR